jgi:hypothetical protein
MTEELFWLSAEELVQLYQRRELSPIETVRAILQHMKPSTRKSTLYISSTPSALSAVREPERRWHHN